MAVLFGIGSMIASKPSVNGGRPCIAGTGTSVRCIAVYDMQGHSPEEIAADRPYLTLAQIHAALAYYWANKAEIDADLAADEEFFDEMSKSQPKRR
ncbi:MAG TPA: DUF433 domain-containing protein [Bryobacteraceae bacterium]